MDVALVQVSPPAARGFSGIKARVPADNLPMLTSLYGSGLDFGGTRESHGYDLKVLFDGGQPLDTELVDLSTEEA